MSRISWQPEPDLNACKSRPSWSSCFRVEIARQLLYRTWSELFKRSIQNQERKGKKKEKLHGTAARWIALGGRWDGNEREEELEG